MHIKQGTRVTTADGQELGQVERVVIDPKTRAVTHLVVQKGQLLPEAKIIPANRIAASGEDQILVMEKVDDLEALPDFVESYTIPVEGEAWSNEYPAEAIRPYYWYPPAGMTGGFTGFPDLGFPYPLGTDTETNLPGDLVALKEGAQVVSAEGEHVGTVSQVVVEETNGRATHLLVSHGLLFKERKLIPTIWIDRLEANEVRLSVGRGLIERLPEYHDEP